MRLLFLVSSSDLGFRLAELTHPYCLLGGRGCEIDIASPAGGRVRLDPMSDPSVQGPWATCDLVNRGFLSDETLVAKLDFTIALQDVAPREYDAIHIVGGRGAAVDLYPCAETARILEHFWGSGKVIGAISHGAIALANVPERVTGLRVTGSSRWEDGEMEALHGWEPLRNSPQVVLEKTGVDFIHDRAWGRRVIIDGQLITGQNQMSSSEYSMALDHMLFGNHAVLIARQTEDRTMVDAIAAE